MNKNSTFIYKYSASENKEVQEIRMKYLPNEENKLDKLKILDRQVQTAGVIETLCLGIIGFLLFGIGICMSMNIIGGSIILGVLFAVVGAVGMFSAYPVCRSIYLKKKEKLTPIILQLASELTGDKLKY